VNRPEVAAITFKSLLLFDVAFLVAYCFGMASAQNLAAPLWFPDAALLCGLLLTPFILLALKYKRFVFKNPRYVEAVLHVCRTSPDNVYRISRPIDRRGFSSISTIFVRSIFTLGRDGLWPFGRLRFLAVGEYSVDFENPARARFFALAML